MQLPSRTPRSYFYRYARRRSLTASLHFGSQLRIKLISAWYTDANCASVSGLSWCTHACSPNYCTVYGWYTHAQQITDSILWYVWKADIHEIVFKFPVFTLQLGKSDGVVGLDVQAKRTAPLLTSYLTKRQLHLCCGMVPNMGTALRS
jgi:hypothetical protein